MDITDHFAFICNVVIIANHVKITNLKFALVKRHSFARQVFLMIAPINAQNV